tara:strand:- start:603 stop:1304 length:702 start_codon:yes stop_codon:yes gene_type:complete
MKIHGTAKGGALSKKDFGVAFSSGGAGLTLDNEEWVCDYSYYHTGSSNNLFLEFLSAEATPSYSGSYFGIGVITQDNGALYYKILTDNNDGSRTEAFYPTSTGRLNAYKGTVLYGRLTRLSSTSIKSESFTDSDRTTAITPTPASQTLTISADIQDLTQLSIWANGNGASNYYSDLKIYNGTTSTSGDPDYEQDFSSSAGWTSSGTSITVNDAYSDAAGSTSTSSGDYIIRNL